mmetsp:Transcript_33928/g.59902  ORF Transcript_33928/g.59902 Transcript_33928/m.59902 type:complete len:252 (+) Transcript_33928:305-1060(+)
MLYGCDTGTCACQESLLAAQHSLHGHLTHLDSNVLIPHSLHDLYDRISCDSCQNCTQLRSMDHFVLVNAEEIAGGSLLNVFSIHIEVDNIRETVILGIALCGKALCVVASCLHMTNPSRSCSLMFHLKLHSRTSTARAEVFSNRCHVDHEGVLGAWLHAEVSTATEEQRSEIKGALANRRHPVCVLSHSHAARLKVQIGGHRWHHQTPRAICHSLCVLGWAEKDYTATLGTISLRALKDRLTIIQHSGRWL